jgi:hypothetical protein
MLASSFFSLYRGIKTNFASQNLFLYTYRERKTKKILWGRGKYHRSNTKSKKKVDTFVKIEKLALNGNLKSRRTGFRGV